MYLRTVPRWMPNSLAISLMPMPLFLKYLTASHSGCFAVAGRICSTSIKSKALSCVGPPNGVSTGSIAGTAKSHLRDRTIFLRAS